MTVVVRTFVAIPERSATNVWERIVELVAPDSNSDARRELAAVAGVACSCIADEALADDALVVYGTGPRLRIYALYGDDAIDGERANESALSWGPTAGDWRMSIPCLADNIAWVRAKLAKSSTRVSARELGAAVEGDDEQVGRASAARSDAAPIVNVAAFFRR